MLSKSREATSKFPPPHLRRVITLEKLRSGNTPKFNLLGRWWCCFSRTTVYIYTCACVCVGVCRCVHIGVCVCVLMRVRCPLHKQQGGEEVFPNVIPPVFQKIINTSLTGSPSYVCRRHIII